MAEKTASKYLSNLEKTFAKDNPVLLSAAKVFHDLDQIEYDLGLLENEETTASKYSWWPIVSLMGGNSTAKSRFINSYLGTDQLLSGIQASSHKFTALLYNNQATPATLPGTALDVDHRYPFYQISHKIEQIQKDEGKRINAYLELKTISSERLKGKLFIDAPNVSATIATPIMSMLTTHIIENSDLVLVFCDVFETSTSLMNELIQQITIHQDTNKFIYLIDAPAATFYPTKSSEIISSWQRRLADLGLNTGQFILLPNQEHSANTQNPPQFIEIDQRLANVEHDRSYRILNALEKSIHDIENVVIPEVKDGIATWKDRVNMTSLLILGAIAMLAVLAELQLGIIIDLLFDPITGSIMALVVISIMLPLHLIMSKMQSKFIVNRLNDRRKELHLMENLGELFESNLTFSRMLFNFSEPAGWNKKTKARLAQLSEKTKELVQSLNDSFSTYNDRGSNSSDD
ncbi:hypothetical protein [Methyloglobulus sp.]|uniref:hypothetical protein n=1 Tax=Methyloglobulus sp. TaxID=2518622 RepID=UPI0017B9828E|nr:hypothetical protein [Methyloglobulus sp.]